MQHNETSSPDASSVQDNGSAIGGISDGVNQPTTTSNTDTEILPTHKRFAPTQRLTVLYILALSMVALLTISGQVLIQGLLWQQSSDSRIINIAGRQRTMAQRLSKAALAIQNAPTIKEREKWVTELGRVAIILERSHMGLQYGDEELGLPGNNSEKVRRIYHGLDPFYEAMLTAVDDLLAEMEQVGDAPIDQAKITPYIEQILLNQEIFLVGMDSLVFQYDHEASSRVAFVKNVELMLMGVTLLVLLMEGLFIFRPAALNIRRAEARVIAIAHKLARTNATLRQTMDEVQQATEAKNEFLAMMSHEIRTPLNAIISMNNLLMDTPLSKEQRELVQTASISGDALLILINDILDFSKIEAGHLDIEQERFPLRNCIEDALDLVAPRAAEKQLDLLYRIDSDVPDSIIGDITRLRQILINLLTNAAKFTDEGEVVVWVSLAETNGIAHVVADGQILLHIAVQDTGIGIPPDRVADLFQLYRQVDASTTRKYGGTGLGLAICKQLVEMMGGNIWIESEVGKGAIFHFTILTTPVAEKSSDNLFDQTILQGKRILLIDENATSRRILGEHVQAWGMTLVAAESGSHALTLLQSEQPFDVILMDLVQHQVDSIALVAEMREYDGTATTLLVVMKPIGLRIEGMEDIEAEAFVTEPIRPLYLHNVLVGVISGQPVHQAYLFEEMYLEIDPHLAEKHPLRILLAEDNIINQKIVLRLLAKIGYTADVVSNGVDVLKALESKTYDVVLMDEHMPELSGKETTRRIRQKFPSTILRVVALTASSTMQERDSFFAAGMDDFLSKPTHLYELVEALQRCPSPLDHSARVSSEQKQLSTPPGFADDPDLLHDLKELFFVDSEQLVAAMQQAAHESDWQTLQRAAHTLKSNSATMGAKTLASLCADLEYQIQQEYPIDSIGYVEKIAAAYAQVRLMLQEQQ